jgi:hypothetical protein
MIFSTGNSFDNSIKYINKSNTLPFTGNYESVSNKKSIYIYCKTSKNDILQIQYSNNKDNTSYTSFVNYTLNNEEKKILLTPELKYFRIYLTTNDPFLQSDLRIYNTNTSDTQILFTDIDGSLLTTSSSKSITSYDAFGRFRTSQPYTLFDTNNINFKNQKFSEYVNPSGSTSNHNYITHNVNESTVFLNCNVSGTCIRESRTIFPYQPGKSLLILNSFVMSDASGLIQRVGYFNDLNGIYFEYNTTGNIPVMSFNIRSNASGLINYETALSTMWNKQVPELNISASQILWIDLEWLGVGSVRCGFVINGQFYLYYTFHHSNNPNFKSVYMTSAQLPIRYEITSNKNQSPTAYLKQICSSIISEGGYQAISVIRHICTRFDPSQNSISASGTILTPMISIRLKNLNGIVILKQLDLLVDITSNTKNLYFEILSNPTISTGNASPLVYTPYSTTYPTDTNSAVEYWLNPLNVSGSPYTVSGGTRINSGFIQTNSNITLSALTDFNMQILRTYYGPTASPTYTSDTIVVACHIFGSGSGNTLAYCQLGWYEI